MYDLPVSVIMIEAGQEVHGVIPGRVQRARVLIAREAAGPRPGDDPSNGDGRRGHAVRHVALETRGTARRRTQRDVRPHGLAGTDRDRGDLQEMCGAGDAERVPMRWDHELEGARTIRAPFKL